MRFSIKCWSEHILSAYKATKDLKHPLYMTFNIDRLIIFIFLIDSDRRWINPFFIYLYKD